MSKQLQNKFNTVFKEWKEYKDFFLSNIEEQNEKVKTVVPDLAQNLDDEDKILQFFYDTRLYPKMYEGDFNLLSLKLVTVYDTVKGEVEVSEDQQKELDDLLKGYRSTQRFIIRSGKAEPINEELIEKTKEQFKKQVQDKELLKGIQDLKDNNG